MSNTKEKVYDQHGLPDPNAAIDNGCICIYSFNGVLDSIDESCPLLLKKFAQAELKK